MKLNIFKDWISFFRPEDSSLLAGSQHTSATPSSPEERKFLNFIKACVWLGISVAAGLVISQLH